MALSPQGQGGENRKVQANGIHKKSGKAQNERKISLWQKSLSLATPSSSLPARLWRQSRIWRSIAPKALRLYERDEDGNKSEVFRVASGSTGVINGNGAVFASVTHDDQKLASITMPIPAGTANAVDYAAEKIGKAITMLNQVEAQFEDAVNAVAAEKAAVRECITVAC